MLANSTGGGQANEVSGPYTAVGPGPGGNPAPVFQNGTWYATSQSTDEIVTTSALGQPWVHWGKVGVHLNHGTQEDPFMCVKIPLLFPPFFLFFLLLFFKAASLVS